MIGLWPTTYCQANVSDRSLRNSIICTYFSIKAARKGISASIQIKRKEQKKIDCPENQTKTPIKSDRNYLTYFIKLSLSL